MDYPRDSSRRDHTEEIGTGPNNIGEPLGNSTRIKVSLLPAIKRVIYDCRYLVVETESVRHTRAFHLVSSTALSKKGI